jgi:hypothetical protein
MQMSQITVDAELRDKLLGAFSETELRDDKGRLLGRFTPSPDPSFFVIPGLDLPPEEVARRLSPDAKTYSTDEVLAHLLRLK